LIGSAENITKVLSENVATLLEPNRIARPGAVKLIKTIYAQRSRAVHGDVVEHEGSDSATARAVSAHVLAAVMERRQFDSRLGIKPTSSSDDRLMKELEDARLTGQRIAGVTPSSAARSLWGNSGSARG
jgi:hypothetical protein